MQSLHFFVTRHTNDLCNDSRQKMYFGRRARRAKPICKYIKVGLCTFKRPSKGLKQANFPSPYPFSCFNQFSIILPHSWYSLHGLFGVGWGGGYLYINLKVVFVPSWEGIWICKYPNPGWLKLLGCWGGQFNRNLFTWWCWGLNLNMHAAKHVLYQWAKVASYTSLDIALLSYHNICLLLNWLEHTG